MKGKPAWKLLKEEQGNVNPENTADACVKGQKCKRLAGTQRPSMKKNQIHQGRKES